jgi:UrcA family protein
VVTRTHHPGPVDTPSTVYEFPGNAMKMPTLPSRVLNTGHLGLLFLATAGWVGCDSIASADAAETRSITVHYRDLDLSRPRAVETLKRRIHRAAEEVCGDYNLRELEISPEFIRCVDTATDKALTEINSQAK